MVRDIKIEEEDSVALDMKNNTYKDGKINVAIILLKRMSNFTDFDVLEMDPRFNPYYTNNIDEIEKADIILLPGSKNTLSDLQSLRANGIAMAIIRAHKAGKKVIGICGGYQMMGVRLEDPESIEGISRRFPVSVFCLNARSSSRRRSRDKATLLSSPPRKIRIVKDTKYIWDEPPYWVTPPNSP